MHWTTEPDGHLDPKVTRDGAGSVEPKTIIDIFRNTVEKHGTENAMALKRKVDGKLPTEWKTWSYQEYYAECKAFAKTLIKLEVSAYKIVNIIGFNSPEWFIANLGSILGGCIAAGIYSTNTPEACMYISDHSKAEVVCCDGNKQLQKYAKMYKQLPKLKCIVVWDEVIDPAIKSQFNGVSVMSWEEFLAHGESIDDAVVNTLI